MTLRRQSIRLGRRQFMLAIGSVTSMGAALLASCGSDSAAGTAAETTSGPDESAPDLSAATPADTVAEPGAVTVTSDLAYGANTTIGGAQQILTMDVYTPPDRGDNSLALLVLLPGGAFQPMTDKANLAGFAAALARQGLVVACINYRTFDGSGGITNPIIKTLLIQGMQDARAAVRFLSLDAGAGNRFDIDPTQIFLGGHSAGAMVSGHAVYLDDASKADPEFQAIIAAEGGLDGTSGNSDGNSGGSVAVAGWIDLAGSLLDKRYITPGSPPMLGVYGTADNIMPFGDAAFAVADLGTGRDIIAPVPVSGTRSLYDQAIAQGLTGSALYAISGGDHFVPAAAANAECLTRIAAFIRSARRS
ncbi:unannotated protein [freshwater metagenome]|uniref:Unannotated protein n=1 Tax=freshwater metagenome TaxID=449393 RepID=A0A6J7EW78_9ZZZZ|nr:carboxylesterase family protein [Actinomycetota bacterium]